MYTFNEFCGDTSYSQINRKRKGNKKKLISVVKRVSKIPKLSLFLV